MSAGVGELHGKFRGVVVDVDDPLRIGRIRARVPAALGEATSSWALPCLPYGSSPEDTPAVGSNVWIEFEQGDPGLPIWSGCWWASAAEAAMAIGVDPTGTASRDGEKDKPGRRGRAHPPGPTGPR